MTALIACPRCEYLLDPVALPYHPEHDLTDVELATLARNDEARQARADAVLDAQIRAEHKRAARAARSKSKREGTR